VQAQILELIADLQQEMGMSVILITHDLGVIAEVCDEVAVMYAGRIVEQASVFDLFANPRHAYTQGLLESIPRLDSKPKTLLKAIPGNVPGIADFKPGCRFAERSGREHSQGHLTTRPALRRDRAKPLCRALPHLRRMSLLTVQNLQQHFPVRGGVLRRSVASCKAVDGVSFTLGEGETLGLVGESGCGKTTLGKAIVRLLKPTSGKIEFDGQDITHAGIGSLRPMRRHVQMIFQDPAESLNPRHTVRDILEEPFIVQKMGTKEERRKWVLDLLDKVGLPASCDGSFSL
jgi:peptide/nickel transport system ATP-binding protein